MKTLIPRLLSIVLALVLVPKVYITMADSSGVPQAIKSGNITYIDIGIQQPNVDDCYEMSVSDMGMEPDWINIYPNPNPGQFTLELNLQHPGSSLVIYIYDITGKVVYESREAPEGNYFHKDLDASHLQKGVYFIRVTGKDRVGVKQVIIN